MKTLHLIIFVSCVLSITAGINSAYGSNQIDEYREKYYSTINVTRLDSIVTDSTEFRHITFGIPYDFVNVITTLKHQNNGSYTLGPFDVMYFLRTHDGIVNKTLIMTVNTRSEIVGSTEYSPYVVPPAYPIPATSHLPNSLNYTLSKNEIEKLKIILPPFPLQQVKSGISANDVTCYFGFGLIFKHEDKSPACVRDNTARYLTERGWAINNTNQESLSLVEERGEEVGIGKNGTIDARMTIDMNIKNFQTLSPPVVITIFYPNGTLYKTDKISSNDISSDGYYKYRFMISSTNASDVYGSHKVYVEHNDNKIETFIKISPPP